MAPTVTLDNMNPAIKVMEYAVRGPLVIRAAEIEKELAAGNSNKPFKKVIRANIGDCHAMGQIPITFLRQLVAVAVYPELLNDPKIPTDVKERAKNLLGDCKGGSIGAYSDSPGIELVRRHCAEYIERRDGIPSNWEDIVLCAGASEGIRSIMKLLIQVGPDGKPPGVMIPIPQYPLYTASIAEYNMVGVSYYMDEGRNWALDLSELKRAIDESRSKVNTKAIVIINPGNPTGQVLTRKNIEEIIKFAYEEKLFVFADEVYQDNVYDKDSKFFSFKKVMTEMGEPYSKIEMASFMSTSKGYMGECGMRGGYAEIINLDPEVKAMYLKSISARLCPTTLGQAALDAVVNPPKPGEPSYEQFQKEKKAVLAELAKRAQMVFETFNSCPGISCNVVQGAMYCFPQIKIPQKAIDKAKSMGQEADFFWCMSLLEKTGICVIPGSGFGQRPGTYHFRTTILPPTDLLKTMLEKLRDFHIDFTKEYS